MSELVIVVTGGRGYGVTKKGDTIARRREAEDERATLVMTLNALQPALVLHGDATGADYYAMQWCHANNVPYVAYPAQWHRYGPSAGPRRNVDMVDDLKRYKRTGKTEIAVVAFPGGDGTKSCTDYAKQKKVRIVKPGDVAAGELVEARAAVVVGQSSLPP